MADHQYNPAGNPDPSAVAARRTRGAWSLRLASFFLVAGLLLLGLYGAARMDRYVRSHELLAQIAADNSAAGRPETPAAPVDPSITPDNSDRSNAEIEKAQQAAAPGEPLGALSIPKIHLDVPIVEGTSAIALNHAIGRIEGTARPGARQGNIGLAGHRDGFFRNLGQLKTGDAVELETPAGTDTYVVNEIRIVRPEDIWVLAPQPVPSLTLVTCYPFHGFGHAPQRYVVTASLAENTAGGARTSEPLH